MSNDFHSGIFDCTNDIGSCLAVALCGWTVIPSACIWARARQERCTLWHCLAPPCPMWARANIRQMGGSTETHYGRDCCAYLWFCPCATCQDWRELDFRKNPSARREVGEELEALSSEPGSVRSTIVEQPPLPTAEGSLYPPFMQYDPQSYQFPAPDQLNYPD
jgi:hypothetical protein